MDAAEAVRQKLITEPAKDAPSDRSNEQLGTPGNEADDG